MKRTVLTITGSALFTGVIVAAGGPAWAATVTQVPAASAGSIGGFAGVDAVSATDGWAVGGNGNGVIQRFNGSRWNLFPSPDLLNGGANWALLTGVDATSAGNALAVGQSTADGGAKTAVALRWNGSQWSRLPVPKPAGSDTEFTAVKAFSASDAWAVGQTTASEGSTFRKTLAMRFNGSTWAAVPTPSPGTRTNFVTAVDGVSASDVWMTGYSLNLPYGNRIRQSMIQHWNGSAWTQVPSPNNGSTFLYDVSAVSSTDAWAVGFASTGGAFVTRWNGSAWNTVAGPRLASLDSVAARSGNDVWVAGSDAAGAPALAHWDGTAWSVTPVPGGGGTVTRTLTAVTVASPSIAWVVGAQQDNATGQSSFLAFRVS